MAHTVIDEDNSCGAPVDASGNIDASACICRFTHNTFEGAHDGHLRIWLLKNLGSGQKRYQRSTT